MDQKVLDNIVVLEYCQMVAGPYCTRLLVDYSARVIKIESPRIGIQPDTLDLSQKTACRSSKAYSSFISA